MGKPPSPNGVKAIFLDRDGVLNRAFIKEGKPLPPPTFEKFHILPRVKEALKLLHEAGFLLIVITNQPDVAKKIQKKEVVEAMHRHLFQTLVLDDIEVCYEQDGPRYKPNPGMLLDAAKKHHINLQASYMIGDRWRDVGAGKAAGCKTIFIDNHYQEKLRDKPNFTSKNLFDATITILDRKNYERI